MVAQKEQANQMEHKLTFTDQSAIILKESSITPEEPTIILERPQTVNFGLNGILFSARK